MKRILTVCVFPLLLMGCETKYVDDSNGEGGDDKTSSRQVTYYVDDASPDELSKTFSVLYVLEGKKLLCKQDTTMSDFGNPMLKLKDGKHILTFVMTRGTNVIYDESNGIISALNSPYSMVAKDTVKVTKDLEYRDVVLSSKTAGLDVHFGDFMGDKIFITMDIYRALNVGTFGVDSMYDQRTLWYPAPADAKGDYTFRAYTLVSGSYETDMTICTKYRTGDTAMVKKVLYGVKMREGEVTKVEYEAVKRE